MGVNIGQVVGKINEKTKIFAGMKVPVKVKINKDTKEFDITVGTPPASQLLKKEAGIEKGSGSPLEDKVADVLIEQIIKIAKICAVQDQAYIFSHFKMF
jgi:large subunit ribosomal protein L11